MDELIFLMSIQNDSITKQDWLSLSHCLCVIFNIFVKDLFNFIRWSINSCLSIQILCEKRDKLKYHLEIWNTNPMDTISIFWFWLPFRYLQSLLTSTTQLLSFGKKKVGVLIYLAFQSFWRWAYLMKMMSLPDEDDEHTWWRWWAYLMKMMSLPDEDEPTWWRWWAYLMKMMSLPDEDYSRNASCTLHSISRCLSPRVCIAHPIYTGVYLNNLKFLIRSYQYHKFGRLPCIQK